MVDLLAPIAPADVPTGDVQREFLRRVREGVPHAVAAFMAGSDPDTMARWAARDSTFHGLYDAALMGQGVRLVDLLAGLGRRR